MKCAAKMVVPPSVAAAAAKAKAVAAKAQAVAKKVIGTLLSKVGCPKAKRRVFGHKSLAKKLKAKAMAVKKAALDKIKKLACGVISKACAPACNTVVSIAS